MSELLALGISHKTAPVALRERLAFTEAEARNSIPWWWMLSSGQSSPLAGSKGPIPSKA
jgi:glutamyl-tRNA reductase